MDPTTKKRAERTVALTRAYRNVFKTKEGEMVLHDLMKVHHVMSTSFTGDATQVIFREGERNVLLRIMGILKTDPQMIQERIRLYEAELE